MLNVEGGLTGDSPHSDGDVSPPGNTAGPSVAPNLPSHGKRQSPSIVVQCHLWPRPGVPQECFLLPYGSLHRVRGIGDEFMDKVPGTEHCNNLPACRIRERAVLVNLPVIVREGPGFPGRPPGKCQGRRFCMLGSPGGTAMEVDRPDPLPHCHRQAIDHPDHIEDSLALASDLQCIHQVAGIQNEDPVVE